MKYNFFKKTIDTTGTTYYLVEAENILANFDFTLKSINKIQTIIDGVEQSQSTGQRYEWANEDVHLLSLADKVYFFDLMARKGNKNHPEGQDLELSHSDFLEFLNNFKAFIEQNS